MEIENHKEEVPFAHYEALFKDLNPQEVLERLPDVGFDGGAFQVTLLGRSFSITYPGCEFSAKDGGTLPPLPTRTFLLRYLLESKQVAFGGEWKTFRGNALGGDVQQTLYGPRSDPGRLHLRHPGGRLQGRRRENGGRALKARRRGLPV